MHISLVVAVLMISASTMAQRIKDDPSVNQGTVQGKVIEAEFKNPMIGASVVIKSLTDSIIDVTVTGADGTFRLQSPKISPFKVEVKYLGMEDISRTLKRGDNFDLGTLVLAEGSKLLGEVTVEGQIPVGEMKGDTAVFNAGAFKTKENGVAEDLISKIPGITIQNGQIQAQGEQVQKVLVDGREFFGNDPSIALKNLPSDMIESVEVLDQRSDQSRLTGLDDGNYAKTINIITKGNMRNSQFGRIYAGYGSDHRYSLGGNINFFKGDKRISIIGLFNNINQQNFSSDDLLGVSGGTGGGGRRGRPGGEGNNAFSAGQNNGITSTNSLGLNYSDKWGEKINFTGSYFFNGTDNSLIQTTHRETVVAEDLRQFYQENLIGSSTNKNHRISGRMEYDVSEKSALIVSPSFSYQDNANINDRQGLNLSGTLDSLSAARTFTDNATDGYNISNNMTYRYGFDKKGRSISTEVYTAWNKRDGISDLLTANRDFVRNSYDTLVQESYALSDGFNYRTNITYTEPINDRSLATVHYQIGNNKSAADQKAFTLANEQGLMVLDTALSNEFDNKFLTQKTGVGYRYSYKNLNLNINVDYQHSSLDNRSYFPLNADFGRDFSNLLPSLILNYKTDRGTSIRLRYRTGTDEPSVNQLQNVIDSTNPLNLSMGNPNLGQSFTNTFFMNISRVNMEKSKTFFVFLNASFTENFIGTETFVALEDTLINQEVLLKRGGQLTIPANLSGRWNSRFFLTYGSPVLALKSHFNLNTSVSYNKTPGIINNQISSSSNIDLSQGFTLSSNVSKDLDFTLSTNGTYSIVNNSLQSSLENNYFIQSSNVKFYYSPNDGKLFVSNNLSNMLYRGLSDGLNQSVWLWNIEAGYRFLKNNKGELKLSIFDLLNQNNTITRTISDITVTDVYTNVLTRYALVSFTYIIGNFRKTDPEPARNFERMRPGAGRSW